MNPVKPDIPGKPRDKPAPPPFSWRDTILSIWESEGVMSSRLISACIVTLVALVLQFWALHKLVLTQSQIDMIEHFIDADYVFAGSLFGIGVGKIVASRFATPQVDHTKDAQQPKPNDTPPA